ncbi:mucin-5AC-like isoform X2 [Haliotis rubra]|uniref:mucin-5AC-like isoform X2 n=1 Tax=Haliotis rubra TaxID=36100 RepID=UPI001EE510E5|nr:mucin-5AC-like isoform X2 [Haliotis rubra]
MPDTRLLFSIALAVLSSHHALGCPAFTSCQTRMAAALGAPGTDTVSLCRALRDYLECARGASASCGVSERGYVVEGFNIVNVRYSTLCTAFRTASASAPVDSTTANTVAPSSATSTVSSATLTSVEGEKTTPEADRLPQNRSATLLPVPSYLPEVTSDYTSPKDQVTTSVTSATTEQMSIATKRDGSACIYLPGIAKQSSEQLCTLRQIMSQFNSGCTQLDDCGRKVSSSLSSPDDFLICGSLVSYITCAQKAKRVCGNVDNSNVQQIVATMYTAKNCTAILKEITTSVEMSPVTARNSVSGQPTEATSGFHQSRKPFPKSTDHTRYGTRSSTEMKKTSPPIPGEFPTIPPPEEDESTRDTSNSQGVGVPSSCTNRSLSVSTVSTVLVSWICWTLYITIT